MLERLSPRQRALILFLSGFTCGALALVGIGALTGDRTNPEAVAPAARPAEGSGRLALSPAPLVGEEPSGPRYPYAITGVVVDTQQVGVRGARVTAREEGGGPARRAISAADGSFAIEDLPLGIYTVEANVTGLAGVTRLGITPDGPPLQLQLHGEGAAVGRLMRDGAGVSGVTVFIGAPGVFPPLRQVSGEGGRVAIEALSGAEVMELAAFGADIGSGFVRRSAPEAGAIFEVPMAPAPPMRFSIRGPEGVTVEEGTVVVSAGPLSLLDVAAPVTEGSSVLEGLPPGAYFARVRAPSFLRWEGTVEHSASGEPIAVVLERGAVALGQVVDPDGEPVAGAVISAVVRDERGGRWRIGAVDADPIARLVTPSGEPFWPPDLTVTTGPDGTFRLAGLPAGRAIVSAAHPGFSSAQSGSLELAAGAEVGGVRLQLDPAP